MSDRERGIKDFPVDGDPDRIVRVEVSYSRGDIIRRGFWMHIQPMRIERSRGFTTQIYNPVDGYRMMVLEVQRFSQKSLDAACDKAHRLVESDPAVLSRVETAANTLKEVTA